MGISIGNTNNNEWHEYKPYPVDNIKKEDNLCETYQISIDDIKFIVDKKYKFIKINLFTNHGENGDYYCKFKFYEFQVFGIGFK